jgi:RimJ/RimL family protein N-acetyltransferase
MIDKENQASMKVAQKIGMSFEREAIDETGAVSDLFPPQI